MPWCFITDACAAYILHAYRKQSQKVPVRELELARKQAVASGMAPGLLKKEFGVTTGQVSVWWQSRRRSIRISVGAGIPR